MSKEIIPRRPFQGDYCKEAICRERISKATIFSPRRPCPRRPFPGKPCWAGLAGYWQLAGGGCWLLGKLLDAVCWLLPAGLTAGWGQVPGCWLLAWFAFKCCDNCSNNSNKIANGLFTLRWKFHGETEVSRWEGKFHIGREVSRWEGSFPLGGLTYKST